MPKKPHVKKAQDKILSDEFTTQEVLGIGPLFVRRAVWDWTEYGQITKIHPTYPDAGFPQGDETKVCEIQKLLDVSSFSATGTDGKVRFRLTQFICFEIGSFEGPINVVATPGASKPVFLTIKSSLVLRGKRPSVTNPHPTRKGVDVEIEVFSWDANGAAAPNIGFDWRCRVAIKGPIFDDSGF